MHPLLLWAISAGFGMAAALVTGSLGLGAAFVAIVLALPLIIRGDSLAALSGLLIGFGGLWLALLTLQGATGATTSQLEGWIMVGAAPLTIGLLASVLRFARTLRKQVTFTNAD
jgi:hypothetical protein